MKRLGFSTIVLPVVLLAFAIPSMAKTRVEMKDAQGKAVGTVMVWQQGPGVGLQLNLHGLTPGEHAIHFHTNAKCEGPDFKSAGAHFNPENKKHGLENPEGHHAGDMQNFTAGSDGTAKTTVTNKDITLGSDNHSVFSNGGTAIVIHAVSTETTSGAPPRIACGVITKPE